MSHIKTLFTADEGEAELCRALGARVARLAGEVAG